MKKTLLFILSTNLLFLNCKEKTLEFSNNQVCEKLARSYDSILKLNKEYVNSSFYKFNEIYKSEKGDISDTILIPKYKAIQVEDEIITLYIDHRIETINYNKMYSNTINDFQGRYILKQSNSNLDEVTLNSVRIENDSCFLYNNNKVISSSKINLINSKGGLTKGLFYIDNKYLINLYGDGFLSVKDKNCLHCEYLHFRRLN